MKLELKHLSGYLPYNTVVFINDCRVDKVKPIHNLHINSGIGGISHVLTSKRYQLVLRTLSEINIDTILIKHYFNKEKAGIHKELELIKKGYYNPLQCSHNICNILMSEHFDIYGLIEAGLAIDINDIRRDNI